MLRSLFVKIFQQNMSLNQRREVPIDLKLNNLDLSGNTTEFKTLPTRPPAAPWVSCFWGGQVHQFSDKQIFCDITNSVVRKCSFD